MEILRNFKNIKLRELNGILTEKKNSIKREKLRVRVGFPQKKASKIDLIMFLSEVVKPRVGRSNFLIPF
jgi:hypothetical protein